MDKKWYEIDWSEEFCIAAIATIAIVSIIFLKTDASNIVSAAGGGLVGYLTRSLGDK